MDSMSETVTATEAGRRLSDLLSRVRYRGESFVILRGGEPVAQLSPPGKPRSVTLGALVSTLLEHRCNDPGFADELESIQNGQPPLESGPWGS
jgi:antitoxin (DNA-binding transcriptional repressor) of toxin-antitoxin stability system